MTLDESIKRFTDNAEYERTHGNLQGCLEFRQLAEWISELKQLREQTQWMCFDGMTNGEVIDLLFPGVVIYHNIDFTLKEMIFPDEWWDKPYKGESEVSE